MDGLNICAPPVPLPPAVQSTEQISGAPDVLLNPENKDHTAVMTERGGPRNWLPQDFMAQSHLASCGLPTTDCKGQKIHTSNMFKPFFSGSLSHRQTIGWSLYENNMIINK